MPRVTCFDNSTIRIRGAARDSGMKYEMLARVQTSPSGLATCVSIAPAVENATVAVANAEAAWITWVGGTEFDLDAGSSLRGFSYKGTDPHETVVSLLQAATTLSYSSHLRAHTSDYQLGMGKFSLSLGQKPDFTRSTDELVGLYQTRIGDAYVEWLLFNYGRYLLFSSSRGVLPPNLQGKWARDSSQPWGSGECYNAITDTSLTWWCGFWDRLSYVTSIFRLLAV